MKLLPFQGALLAACLPRALPRARSFCPFRALSLLHNLVQLVEILLSTLQASGYSLLEVLLGSFVILIENGEATTGIIYFGSGASLLQVLLCAYLVTSVDGCKGSIQIGSLSSGNIFTAVSNTLLYSSLPFG